MLAEGMKIMYVIHVTGPFTDNTQHISQQTRRWHVVGTMYKRLLEVTGQLTCLSTPIIRYNTSMIQHAICRLEGGGPRVVVSTAAFHARVRGSVPGLGGLKETKMFLPHPRVKVSIVGSLRDREVACSASDRQGSNFESCVWRTVSSQSSHHPQEVLLAQFSLYVHKGGLKPDSFHYICRLEIQVVELRKNKLILRIEKNPHNPLFEG